jgi:hypothetical protein
MITRAYHVRAVPLRSRRLRILADGLLSVLFRRDIAELGTLEVRRALPPGSSADVQQAS